MSVSLVSWEPSFRPSHQHTLSLFCSPLPTGVADTYTTLYAVAKEIFTHAIILPRPLRRRLGRGLRTPDRDFIRDCQALGEPGRVRTHQHHRALRQDRNSGRFEVIRLVSVQQLP